MPDILDNLTRVADAPPALNATTDMPAIAPPDLVLEPTIETPAEQPSETPPAPAETPPHPDARERRELRFSELTRQRDAERERAAKAIDAVTTLTEQNKALIERIDQIIAPKPDAAAQPEPRPTRDAFDAPEAYDDALIAWSARSAAREAAHVAQAEWEKRAEAQRQADAARQAQASQEATAQKIFDDWNQRREAAIEKYPDFEAVAETHPNMTMAMRDALWTAEDGPEVAYYLGQHQDEAAAITKMHPVQQVIAIARIGAKLSAPPPQPPPPPPPINPLRGGNSSPALSPDEDPGYMDRRLAELRAARTPGNIGMIKQ